MNLSNKLKPLQKTLTKQSPAILTGLAVTGVMATTLLAIRATPKALQLMEEYDFEQVDNPKIEKLKVVLPVYVPTIVTATATVACIIGSHTISSKRTAALASLYSVSEMAMKEYQKKVIDTIGEKKEQKVKDDIDKDYVERSPVQNTQVIITGKGDHLIFDKVSGRYFKSDIEKLRQVVNEYNSNLIVEMSMTLNDLYYELGLEPIGLGQDTGWTCDEILDPSYSSQLTSDGSPCIVFDVGRPRWLGC